jgi:hypothetical protein
LSIIPVRESITCQIELKKSFNFSSTNKEVSRLLTNDIKQFGTRVIVHGNRFFETLGSGISSEVSLLHDISDFETSI